MTSETSQEKQYCILRGSEEHDVAGMAVTFQAGLEVKWWTDSTAAHFRTAITPIDMSSNAAAIVVSSPHRRALMEFSSYDDLRQAQKLFQSILWEGRKIQSDIAGGADNYKLILQNLPPTVSTSQILHMLNIHGCNCTLATVGYRSPAPSVADVKEFVSALVEREGISDPEVSYLHKETGKDLSEPVDFQKSSFKLIAVFNNVKSPIQALSALHGKEFAEMDFAKISIIPLCLTQIWTSQEIYLICKPQLDEQRAAIEARTKNTNLPSKLSICVEFKGLTSVRIYLFSSMWKEVQTGVTEFRKILNGHLLRDGEKQLWHDCFSQSQGQELLKSVCATETSALVKLNVRKRCLYAYGITVEQRKTLEQAIGMRLVSMTTFEQVIPLEPNFQSTAVSRIFKLAVTLFGKERVSIYNNQSVPETLRRPSILVQVNAENRRLLSHFASGEILPEPGEALSEIHSTVNSNPADQLTAEECVICSSEPSDPVITKCSHLYCSDCFLNMCKAAFSSTNSINCFGGLTFRCGRKFPIEELREYVGAVELEKLLCTSFMMYARKNPQQLLFCPTPDCNHVYRNPRACAIPSAYHRSRETHWVCRNCLETICLHCNALHTSQSCEQYQLEHGKEIKGELAWKSEHGFKDCRSCGTPIEKGEGCPYVRCSSCLAHLCWICMAAFPTEHGTYNHIKAVHQVTE